MIDDNISKTSTLFNSHAKGRTHWVYFIEKCRFDSSRCAPPKRILNILKVNMEKGFILNIKLKNIHSFHGSFC